MMHHGYRNPASAILKATSEAARARDSAYCCGHYHILEFRCSPPTLKTNSSLSFAFPILIGSNSEYQPTECGYHI